jgi:RNA polymerase sigma factor (sigma-70 family)
MPKLLIPGWILGKRTSKLSNAHLIQQFLQHRSDDAFSELVRRHFRVVYGVCRRVLGNNHDAEDAVQATFIVLARHADSVRKPQSLASWLHGVAYRTALELRTMRNRHQSKVKNSNHLTEYPNRQLEDSDQELSAILDEEISLLPEHYRLPLVLSELQGHSRLQVSQMLGIPCGTVSSRLAMAKKKLALRLRRRGVAVTVLVLSGFFAKQLSAQVPSALVNLTTHSILQASVVPGVSQVQHLASAVINGMLLYKLQRLTVMLVSAALLSIGFSAWVLAADEKSTIRTVGCTQITSMQLPQRIQTKSEGTLTGSVLDSDGNPVEGALVYLENFKLEKVTTTRTDALGKFRYGPITAGIHPYQYLYIEAPGFARQYVAQSQVYPNSQHDLGIITLWRGKVFRGRMVDHEGKPVAKANLEIRNWHSFSGNFGVKSFGPNYSVETDADGYYQTPPIADGILTVEKKLPNQKSSMGIAGCNVTEKTNNTLATYQLPKPEVEVPHVFRVIDEDGKPIIGAKLIGDKDRIDHEVEGVTDSEGKYVLRGYGPHPHGSGRIYKEGYASTYWDFRTSHEPLVLTRAATIEGKVVDAQTGKALQLQKIVLVPQSHASNDDGWEYRRWTETEMLELDHFVQKEDGTFRLVHWNKPDQYRLCASATGYRDAEIVLGEVSSKKHIASVEVTMEKQAPAKQQVSGKVTRGSKPVPIGWIALYRLAKESPARASYMLRGRTTPPTFEVIEETLFEDGKYSLHVPVEDKQWYLIAYEKGQAPMQIGPFVVQANEQKELNIAGTSGAEIQGRVTHMEKALRGKLAVVAFNRLGYRTEVLVQADGGFRLKDLPAGEYGLKVGHNTFQDEEVKSQNKYDSEPCFFGNWKRTEEEEKRFQRWVKADSEDWQRPSSPWKRAKLVNVIAGQRVQEIELELPEK